ncbi:hypothetical protein [Spirosoma aerophilum]
MEQTYTIQSKNHSLNDLTIGHRALASKILNDDSHNTFARSVWQFVQIRISQV